ncbi:uncharacterized protein BX663DRAFT_549135 [Cokeromyces recurvatus]|uniref:uncharacterized protein n=1 Tax=Cokeromyces recurvatus TaxID=90255 RepID=UPI00221FECDA|nr:uncharacterized protein BX663DRAFT_549135 [Cokeromyces recurvatus]KAI7906014.1 hypothetical protein BX663DRAFT_549135 [Cokeromyces recurvatus]
MSSQEEEEEEKSMILDSFDGCYLFEEEAAADDDDDEDIIIDTSPPLAEPPSDASYDESFIELIKRYLKRAQEMTKSEVKTWFSEERKSFDSLINYDLCTSDNEFKAVEKGRADAIDCYKEELPLYLIAQEEEEKERDMSLPEFAVLKQSPMTVRDLNYTTNKKIEQEHMKDFSSWLCFDSEDELVKFKDEIKDDSMDSFKENVIMSSTPVLKRALPNPPPSSSSTVVKKRLLEKSSIHDKKSFFNLKRK